MKNENYKRDYRNGALAFYAGIELSDAIERYKLDRQTDIGFFDGYESAELEQMRRDAERMADDQDYFYDVIWAQGPREE